VTFQPMNAPFAGALGSSRWPTLLAIRLSGTPGL
jgi:hypothetical protein